MYLKALEIQGFKSFPEKTRLTFEKPVTAIVGPNGSGKSNISDALRWVMGEQSSKALRGGKMEDVIFGGTERRKQLGFAEVTLVVDNSSGVFSVEENEVAITRRYYRSGESEYYINRENVRLKDVNELLMDTGLGKEGYSIIGQGRIDEILSAKSTDRREIFEEAAGISRYRHRKEESERKLEHTDENLLRVNDKIAELELQVEPLRTQAETAKKYLILRDEMRDMEISVWMENLDRLAKDSEKLQQDWDSARESLDKARRELDELYKSSEEFAEKMHGKDVEAESVREEISALEGKSAELDSAAAVLKANLQHNIESAARVKEGLAQQEDRESGISAQIVQREERMGEIDGSMAKLSEKAAGCAEELEAITGEAGEAAKELAGYMREENETAERLSAAKGQLSALASAAQELSDREGSSAADISKMTDRLAEARSDAEKNTAELKEADDAAKSAANMVAGYKMRVESRRKKAGELEDKNMRLTMERNALISRINLLAEMEKEYQGYSRAVKTVMQDAERGVLKHIHGTVGANIRVEDKYALAVETALGGAMQNIIVSSEEDGKAAINMLKRRDAGRATFLPMTSVKGSVLNERGLQNEEGFFGIASELVKFDECYRGIYTSLLGRTAVVEDMDCAIRISRRFGSRFRIVTLDGQIINSGGSMTGGSASKNTGILSRANELKRLESGRESMDADCEKAKKELESVNRELSAAEYELETASGEMREAEDKVLRLQAAAEHHKALIEAMEGNLRDLREDSKGVREKLEQNGIEIENTRKDITVLRKKAEAIQGRIEAASQGQEQLTQKREDVMTRLSEIRAERASLEAERAAIEQAKSELLQLRASLSGGREQQLQMLEELARQNEDIEAELHARELETGRIAGEIADKKQRLSEISAEKLEIEAQRTRRDKETQEKNNTLLQWERECSRLEQKKLAAGMEEKQLADKLWDNYELTRTMAQEARHPVENMQEAARRIGELKREIGKLGNPNIGAIDEFERVNTRYTFLTDQRDDIEKSKNELLGIIGDITSEMEEIFAREFASIDKSFRETFLELFGGGKAALELEDPEDILNCGIEIKVQPPGKSLKTLTLLSGGERAFVAIALYFAILKVRPTPFCVMDEIEAALDEANVLRYANYMRRMADKTQFIVITHRRGTMEEADVLYGVTMQEQGVSRVLDIDLDDAEKTIAS